MSPPDPVAVEATFSSVAKRYDLANHWLSVGIDFYWRKKLVNFAKQESPGDILDLATGSGDVLFALRESLGEEVRRGRAKVQSQRLFHDLIDALRQGLHLVPR